MGIYAKKNGVLLPVATTKGMDGTNGLNGAKGDKGDKGDPGTNATGDTGWRKMPTAYPNAGNGNQLLRRTGNVVTAVIEGTYGGTYWFTLDAGFRPRYGFRVEDPNGLYYTTISNNEVRVQTKGDPGYANAQVSWTTEDAWPSVLPGESFENPSTSLPITLSGPGFPEGIIAAPVGSKWIDTQATNGALEWMKKSGTGNTGWVVTVGDTGWRNVKSLMSANALSQWDRDGSSCAFRARRVNERVYWSVEGYLTNGLGSWTAHIDDWPLGFAPDAPARGYLNSGKDNTTCGVSTAQWSGRITTLGAGIGGYHNDCGLYLEHSTSQPWPATLPGTA